MKREPIPKSIRFDVFKRDKFTCQYCGASAPDVILEIDHIKPVSKGGKNELLNLVTACRDCNRGKTNHELSDNAAVMVQKKNLVELQERREQLEMMMQWKEMLEDTLAEQVESIDRFFSRNTNWTLAEGGKNKIRKLIRQFGFGEVYTACEIAVDSYYNGTEGSWDNAFNKIGGICYNRNKRARENDA